MKVRQSAIFNQHPKAKKALWMKKMYWSLLALVIVLASAMLYYQENRVAELHRKHLIVEVHCCSAGNKYGEVFQTNLHRLTGIENLRGREVHRLPTRGTRIGAAEDERAARSIPANVLIESRCRVIRLK